MIKSYNKLLLIILFCLVYACKNKGSRIFSSSISELISIENPYHYYENYDGYIIKENSVTKEKIWEHKKLYDLSIKVFDTRESIYYTTPNEVISIDKINGEVNFIINERVSIRTNDFISYNNEIIASSSYGVYSFSKTSGKILWSLLPSSSTILTDPKMLINNDILFIAGRFKPETKSSLFAYDLRDKSKINEIDLPKEIITNIKLIENNLIFGIINSILSVNKDDFKINWELEQNLSYSSKILRNKNNSAFFNFKNQIFELNVNSLEVKQRFKLPNNYFELFGIRSNQLICTNNSSLAIYSLTNSKERYFKNIMTHGPWEFNNEIYFVNKTLIKKLSELE